MTPDSCDKQVKRRSNLGPYRKMESALKLHEPAHQVTCNKGRGRCIMNDYTFSRFLRSENMMLASFQ